MVSIGKSIVFLSFCDGRLQAAPVCRAAPITLGGAMVVAICRTVASSAPMAGWVRLGFRDGGDGLGFPNVFFTLENQA